MTGPNRDYPKPDERRHVEFRVHRDKETWIANQVHDFQPPYTWPASYQTLSGGRVTLLQVRPSRFRYDSWIMLNGAIIWSFTWRDTNAWTVEEFLYDGVTWRIEYRTRFPELDET